MSWKCHPSGQNTDTKVTFFATFITPKNKAFPQPPFKAQKPRFWTLTNKNPRHARTATSMQKRTPNNQQGISNYQAKSECWFGARTYEGGNETAENPYQFTTAGQLHELSLNSENWNNCFVLQMSKTSAVVMLFPRSRFVFFFVHG